MIRACCAAGNKRVRRLNHKDTKDTKITKIVCFVGLCVFWSLWFLRWFLAVRSQLDMGWRVQI